MPKIEYPEQRTECDEGKLEECEEIANIFFFLHDEFEGDDVELAAAHYHACTGGRHFFLSPLCLSLSFFFVSPSGFFFL